MKIIQKVDLYHLFQNKYNIYNIKPATIVNQVSQKINNL